MLTLTDNAYEVKDINAIIAQKLPNTSINLVVDHRSARCKIVLKQWYNNNFTHNDTFRDILGFKAVIVDQAYTESLKICDLVISTNIYIHLDEAQGSIFNGNSFDIVYSFSNNIEFAYLINLNLRLKTKYLLLTKYFSNITVNVTDQNNNIIHFLRFVITVTFEIK